MSINENNEFESGTGGFTPQKPFTDNSALNSADNQNYRQEPTTDFVPKNVQFTEASQSQQDNRQNDFAHGAPTSDYNVTHENYNGGRCEYNAAGQHEKNTPYGYGFPQQNQPQGNDFSNPVYQPTGYGRYNSNVNNVPQQPNNYQQYNNRYSNYSTYCGEPVNNNYQQIQPKPVKKKMGAGLITLIIILSVLLAGSAIGLVAYVTYNNVNNNPDYSDNSDNNSFGFTMPGNGDDYHNYGIQQETTAPSVHEESDYSNKTDSGFGGINLNEKPKNASTNNGYNSAYAYNYVSSSVVGVVCYSDEITTVENCSSQGSGIILTSDGYILTNAHVVGNSKTAYLIQIITADGKEYNAGVVGYDTRTDIAVLKIDNVNDLKAATWGNSDRIELGEDIIVVGNPGGLDYQNSITKGVISAVNRELSSSSLVKYIQTDAAINPGNSGGPIVNMYGQIIGVATSKIVSEKYEGMGFAIPSATVKSIADNIIKNGYVKGRVKIGIAGSTVSASVASANDVPQGILVSEITPGGPCDGTEIKTDDIITEADGKEVKSFSDIYEILEQHKAGDKITLKYYRHSDDSEGTVEVTLQEDK